MDFEHPISAFSGGMQHVACWTGCVFEAVLTSRLDYGELNLIIKMKKQLTILLGAFLGVASLGGTSMGNHGSAFSRESPRADRA